MQCRNVGTTSHVIDETTPCGLVGTLRARTRGRQTGTGSRFGWIERGRASGTTYDPAMEPVDIIVVGGGLIGSAAARHLAESGQSVVALAAPEPTDWSAGVGPFGSHYDAGRITRIIARDPAWSILAKRSIERYADIEQRSGITFHTPCGLAWMDSDLSRVVADAQAAGSLVREVTAEELRAETGIQAPSGLDLRCAIEPGPAGVVNPRRLVAAQLHLAAAAGARVVPAAAEAVSGTVGAFTVSGGFGEVQGRRVLLATGAYGAELAGVDLGLQRWLRTTVRAELEGVTNLPSAIAEAVPVDHALNMYWNPPVEYPDGRVLFKIGCEVVDPPLAEAQADINRWFTTKGDPAERDALLELIACFLPDAIITNWDTVPCVITSTSTGFPHVDWVADGVAVALGGNGSSAKSSDEIGRLAATLFDPTAPADDELEANTFAIPATK